MLLVIIFYLFSFPTSLFPYRFQRTEYFTNIPSIRWYWVHH